MTIFFGLICLKIAFLSSLIQTLGVVPHPVAKLARPACQTTALFMISAFFTLVISMIKYDTNLLIVAGSAFSGDPWYVRVSGLWNVHVGIIMIWMTLLALFSSFYVIISKKQVEDRLSRPAIGIQGFLQSGFLLYMILFVSPFETNKVGLLLRSAVIETHWHHLFFYAGYMLISVAYALCIGVLIEGKPVSLLLSKAVPWLSMGWISLALGVVFTLISSLLKTYLITFNITEGIALIALIMLTALITMLPKIEEDRFIKKFVLLVDIALFFLALVGSLWFQTKNLVFRTYVRDSERSRFLFIFLAVVFLFSLVVYLQRVMRSLRKNRSDP
jgi:cytochrome c-type biogenesis protein CcmF